LWIKAATAISGPRWSEAEPEAGYGDVAVSGAGGRWSVAQAAVPARGVVKSPPCIDQHLGFGEAVENLAIEQFVAKRPAEAFVIAILPW